MQRSSSTDNSSNTLLTAIPRDAGLSMVELVAWNLDVNTEKLSFIPHPDAVHPIAFTDVCNLNALLALMPPTDKYLFQQTFSAPQEVPGAPELRSCEVRLLGSWGELCLRFSGQLRSVDNELVYDGVAINAQHWLAASNHDNFLGYFSQAFGESLIPSFVTDTQGVILQLNRALEQMFLMSPEQAEATIGRYSILRDKYFRAHAAKLKELVAVYQQGRTHSVEMHYSLGNIYRSRFIGNKKLYFRLSFLPLRDRAGCAVQFLVQLQDLSQEKNVRDALQESEASYKAFITNSSEAIWCYDIEPKVSVNAELEIQVKQIAEHARLIEANTVMLSMLGATSLDEVLGLGLTESGSSHYVFDLHHFVNHHYQMVDHDIVRKDQSGKSFYFQISCTGIVEDGYLKRVWGTTKDVTTRRRFEEKLQHQSLHDALTGLPNREKLYLDMEECFQQRNAEQISALLLIDLDRFKEINDTLGHNVGDRLLQLIGPRLALEMAEVPGTVARLGGDEFAVFLPRIRSTHQAVVFGHRILDALAQEFDLDGFCTQITASIGISLAPQQALDFHALMRYADIAMYHAKTRMIGLSIYSSDYDPHSPKRLAMIGELGRAIREDQLCLYYQPKVLLDEQRCFGFEALIRWIHPELGFVPPDDFIPIAELTSLIHPLTAWVLEKSIAQCRSWQDQGLALSIAVNLSARNLMDENMPKLVERLLNKYEVAPSRLELEITESAIMSDPNRAMRVLESLHNLGVHLAIDDFGTGYSSLAYLKRLPVQTLKIDNSFVRNMLEDLQDELIVNSTINLAHNLGLTVVAEGVENEALLERLKSMGCDEAQGYFIGRPMAINNADEWLVASGWMKSEV